MGTNGHEWARMGDGEGMGRATIELVFSAFDGALRPCPGQEGGVATQSPANRWHTSGMVEEAINLSPYLGLASLRDGR